MSCTFSLVAVVCDDYAPFPHSGDANACQKLCFCCKNKNKTDFEREFSEITSNSFTCFRKAWEVNKRGSQVIVHIKQFQIGMVMKEIKDSYHAR